jgi:hypothetical protein
LLKIVLYWALTIEKGIDGEAPGSTLSESGSFAARAAERHGTATAPEPLTERNR